LGGLDKVALYDIIGLFFRTKSTLSTFKICL